MRTKKTGRAAVHVPNFSEVLILSRTRMGEGKICVGGYCFRRNKNVRLLNSAWGRLSESEPYKIGDIYLLSYSTVSNPKSFHPIIAPHIEDVSVSLKKYSRVLSHVDFMNTINALTSYNTNIRDVFEGCLKWEKGKGFLLKDAIPKCGSVLIARLTHDLVMNEANYQGQNNVSFHCTDSFGNDYNVGYVGCNPLRSPLIIKANTPIRFSLARFWDKGDGVDRSYLQLSGFYS